MEGPSLVIACDEFAPYFKQKVRSAIGTAKIPFSQIKGHRFVSARSWGKHLILDFEKLTLRIHFLMFGSYRINNPRENRVPKMTLKFGDDVIYFYSCAIKVLAEKPEDIYDWSIDTMSKAWRPAKAVRRLEEKPETMVCDVLMDQTIFAGVGNIIKNEVLFRQSLHPEQKVGDLTDAQRKALVKDVRAYCLLFYKWKKANQLKKNWLIFRKKVCPVSGDRVIKKPTGRLERISHYCPSCQKKVSNERRNSALLDGHAQRTKNRNRPRGNGTALHASSR